MLLLDKFIAKNKMRIRENLFMIVQHIGFWFLYFLLITLLISSYTPFKVAALRIILNGFVMSFAFYFNALVLVNHLLEQKKYAAFFISAGMVVIVSTIFRFLLLKLFERAELNFVIPENTTKLMVFSFMNQLIVVRTKHQNAD